MFAVALALILSFINIFIVPELDTSVKYAEIVPDMNYTINSRSSTPFTDIISGFEVATLKGSHVKTFCDLSIKDKEEICIIVCNKFNGRDITLPCQIPDGYNYGYVLEDNIYDYDLDTREVYNIQYNDTDNKYHIPCLTDNQIYNDNLSPTRNILTENTYIDDNDDYQCYAIVDDSTNKECGILFAAVTEDVSFDFTADTENYRDLLEEYLGYEISGGEVIDICKKLKDSNCCVFISNDAVEAYYDQPDYIKAYNYCVLAKGMYDTESGATLKHYRLGAYSIKGRLYDSKGNMQHNTNFEPLYNSESIDTYVDTDRDYTSFSVIDESTNSLCGILFIEIAIKPFSFPAVDEVDPLELDPYYKDIVTGDEVRKICSLFYKNPYAMLICTKNNDSSRNSGQDLHSVHNYGTIAYEAVWDDDAGYVIDTVKYDKDLDKYRITGFKLDDYMQLPIIAYYNYLMRDESYTDNFVDPGSTFKMYYVVDDANEDYGFIFIEG